MLSFNKRYYVTKDKKPIAQIFAGEKRYGYIYYTENWNEDDVSDEEEENNFYPEKTNKKLFQCKHCHRVFNYKHVLQYHEDNACQVKKLSEYGALIGKGKKIGNDVLIKKDSVKLLHKDLKFKPICREYQREILICYGPQNSGKSYFVGMYANDYQVRFPENDVILCSRIEDDESYAKYIDDPVRITISEKLLDEPIDIKNELAPSLTIFDDIDNSMNGKELQNYVWNLASETMVNGRDQAQQGNDIYVACTLHISEGMKTRKMLNEANIFCVFQPYSNYQTMRLMKLYGGLTNQQINKVKEMSSRWCCIYKTHPLFIMGEHDIILLK